LTEAVVVVAVAVAVVTADVENEAVVAATRSSVSHFAEPIVFVRMAILLFFDCWE
jgi:hypothetical protein